MAQVVVVVGVNRYFGFLVWLKLMHNVLIEYYC